VVIGEAFNTSESSSHSRSSSTVLGGSASVAGISIDTLRNAGGTLEAMSNTSDGRMQALGAVNLALQGKQAYDAAMSVAKGAVGYKVSASISHSNSESQSTASSREAVGSSIVGANQVNIVATGGAADSNIRVVGSTIGAGSTAHLQADNTIGLEASQSSSEQQGSNRSSGASVGVSFGAGAQNGFTIELGVSKGKGIQNGSEVLHTNTHVTGGQSVHIVSGGDTTLRGAVVDAPQISADVGGDLRIQSLQDTSKQIARQSSSGLNLSLCIPPICYGTSTVSGSAAAAKANGSYASVVEQSGIRAGDGGFQVQVQGSTDLKGGVISSTQAANDAKLNQFDTKSLDSSDIQNHNVYKASSYAVSASFSAGVGDQDSAKTEEQQRAARGAAKTTPGGSAGAGRVSVSETSTTSSGISGIAGDTTVRTGDASSTGALVKDWNAQALLKDVEAQARITQEFGQHASKAVGDYAQQKYTELMNSDPAEAAKWAEGGAYRVAAHAAVGALTGGLNGSVGAGASAYVTATIGKSIDDMDLPAPVKQMLGAASAAAVGAVGGGTAGAATGFAVDLNNRQQHSTERQALQANAKVFATHLQELGYSSVTEERALAILQEQVDNRIDYTQANRLDTATMDPYIQAQAGKFLNALSSSLGSYDDGRGHQIRYFTNVTADGERLIGDYHDPSINAMPHFPPIDYVALQSGKFGMNVNLSVSTHDGEIFLGGVKSTLSSQYGGSLVVGRMLHGETDPIKRARLVADMLRGASIQSSICASGFCAGINQSIGPKESNPATAVELGIGTPGISVGAGASISTR
jgi:filamentous hemagglutinin